jgi:hypothetical protein
MNGMASLRHFALFLMLFQNLESKLTLVHFGEVQKVHFGTFLKKFKKLIFSKKDAKTGLHHVGFSVFLCTFLMT